MTISLRLLCAALLLSLFGCTSEPVAPVESSQNPAVRSLIDGAHADLEAGRTGNATASLERALRIEPRNPRVWHELALAHLRGGDPRQAEGFAARSNAWAGGDRELMAANWRVIAEARSRRGDEAGAQAAREKEEALSP